MDTYIIANTGRIARRCAWALGLRHYEWIWLVNARHINKDVRCRFIMCNDGEPSPRTRYMKTLADLGEAFGKGEVWVVTIDQLEGHLAKRRENLLKHGA